MLGKLSLSDEYAQRFNIPSVNWKLKWMYILCAASNVLANVPDPRPVSKIPCQRYLKQGAETICHYSVRPSLYEYCYDFSYFVLFTYVFSLFLEVSHGAANLTHFSLTHITATLLTHCTAVVLTHSIAILIALPHRYSIYSGHFCRLFSS